jgi:hypothetical protein
LWSGFAGEEHQNGIPTQNRKSKIQRLHLNASFTFKRCKHLDLTQLRRSVGKSHGQHLSKITSQSASDSHTAGNANAKKKRCDKLSMTVIRPGAPFLTTSYFASTQATTIQQH